MFSFFRKKRTIPTPLATDMHSHLIPGIDDGVKTPEESIAVIGKLMDLGYKKLITTPHIMTEYFGNTSESVRGAYESFMPQLENKLPFEAAAEYYLDDQVIKAAANKTPFLTFGEKYVLFETNVISEPLQLKEFVFSMSLQGYKPVLAHPERYIYMSLEKAEELRERGVLLQINLLSLIGHYSIPIQRLAEKMISRGLVDMLGSDCHNMQHADLIPAVHRTSAFRKAMDLPLINHRL